MAMSKPVAALAALGLFTLGLGVGLAAKKSIDPGLYTGKEPQAAADALLKVARDQAGDGSWERIAVGRAYYLSGRKAEGQAIFDAVGGEATDLIRIGRVYYQAGEWDRAKEVFDRVLALAPKDEDWHAEIGAYYNLKGDRPRAEELFRKSFSLNSEVQYNTVKIAGSYVGVQPD